MMGNSPLELHSANSANFGRSQTLSLASRPKFAENYESQIENPSVVVAFSHESKKNKIKSLLKFLLRFAFAKSRIHLHLAIARFGNAESKQSTKNKCASAHRISPDSWCKKSESKGAVVPPADFLLESEKRGSPPKSEKAAAFWRVGGAGRGVQPFLRKENYNKDLIDSKADLSAESHKKIDSRFALDSRDLDSSLTVRSLRMTIWWIVSAINRLAMTNLFLDCHKSALPNLAMTNLFRNAQNSSQRLNLAF